jgi:hypothetical protein
MKFIMLFVLLCSSNAFSSGYSPLGVVWGEKNWVSEEDLSGKYKLSVTEEHLKFEIFVTDDQVNLSEEPIHSDHIEIWLALPPNPYTDQPNGFKHLQDLNSTYWIDPKFGSDILSMSGDYQNAGPNCIWDYFEQTKFKQKKQWFGLRHLGIFPKQEKAVSYETDKSQYLPSQLLDKDIKVKTKEVSSKGYHVEVTIPVSSFGVIPVGGLDSFRYMIDIIDVDSKRQETLLSSSSLRKWGKPSSFNTIEFESNLGVSVSDALSIDEESDKEYLLSHLSGYYIYDKREWRNLIVGSIESLGNDLCSYNVSRWASKYEANIIKSDLDYEKRILGDVLIERVNDVYYVDGKKAFTSSIGIESIYDFDDGVLIFSDLRNSPTRGMYAKGPCAGGTNTTAYIAIYDGVDYREENLVSWGECRSNYSLGDIVKPLPTIDPDLLKKSQSESFGFKIDYDSNKQLIRLISRDVSLDLSIDKILENQVSLDISEVYDVSGLMNKLSDNTRFEPVETHEKYFYEMLEKHVGYENHEYYCQGIYSLTVALLIRDKLKLTNSCRLDYEMVLNEVKKGKSIEEIKESMLDEFFYLPEPGKPYNILYGLDVAKGLAKEGLESKNSTVIDLSIFYFNWIFEVNDKRISEGLSGLQDRFYDFLYYMADYREQGVQETLNKFGNAKEMFKEADIRKINFYGPSNEEVVEIIRRHEFSDEELVELYIKNYFSNERLLAINSVYDVEKILASYDYKKIISVAVDVSIDWNLFKTFLDTQKYFHIGNEGVKEYLAFESLRKPRFYPSIIEYLPKKLPIMDGVDPIEVLLDARPPSPYFVSNHTARIDLTKSMLSHYKPLDLSKYLLKSANREFLYVEARFGTELFEMFLPEDVGTVGSESRNQEVLDVAHKYLARDQLINLLELGFTNATDETVIALFNRFHYMADLEMLTQLAALFPKLFDDIKVSLCESMPVASIVDGGVEGISNLYDCASDQEHIVLKIKDNKPKGDLALIKRHSHSKYNYLVDFVSNTYSPITEENDFVNSAALSHNQEYLLMSVKGRLYLNNLKDGINKWISDEFDYPVWINEYSFWARHSVLKEKCIVYLDGSSHCGEKLRFNSASYIGADGVAIAKSSGSHYITYDYGIEESYKSLVSDVYTDCPDSLSFDRNFLAMSDRRSYGQGSIVKIYDIKKDKIFDVPSSTNGTNCPSFSSKLNKVAYRVKDESGFGVETYDIATGKIERLNTVEQGL